MGTGAERKVASRPSAAAIRRWSRRSSHSGAVKPRQKARGRGVVARRAAAVAATATLTESRPLLREIPTGGPWRSGPAGWLRATAFSNRLAKRSGQSSASSNSSGSDQYRASSTAGLSSGPPSPEINRRWPGRTRRTER